MSNTLNKVRVDMNTVKESVRELAGIAQELYQSLVEVRADLFYQIESKHGAKVARNYPSIKKADALIKKLEK